MIAKDKDYRLFGKTKNNLSVFMSPLHSHASSHFTGNPKLESAVIKALASIDARGDNIQLDFDTGQIVGYSDLVETKDGDEIIYAKDEAGRFTRHSSNTRLPFCHR